jgi:hypothetical protein
MSIKNLARRAVPARVWSQLFRMKHVTLPAFRHRREIAEVMEQIGTPPAPIAGPFAGMRYLERPWGNLYYPKLLGTYELEIRDQIEWLAEHEPDVLVNVGASDGYYTVGMAMRCPQARVIAYDIDAECRKVLAQLVGLNDVFSRVEIRSECTVDELQKTCAGAQRPAVIIDCEGFEDVLLDPQRVPALSKATILAEVHDCFVPGLTERLRERFEGTHELTIVEPRERTKDDLPPKMRIGDSAATLLMYEHRVGADNTWMFMCPRVGAPANERSVKRDAADGPKIGA